MQKVIFMLFFMVAASTVSAASATGKVKGFYINNSGTVLVKFDTAISGCTHAWPLGFSIDSKVGKEWFSMILAARTSNKTIKVGYNVPDSGTRCTSISYFYFYDN